MIKALKLLDFKTVGELYTRDHAALRRIPWLIRESVIFDVVSKSKWSAIKWIHDHSNRYFSLRKRDHQQHGQKQLASTVVFDDNDNNDDDDTHHHRHLNTLSTYIVRRGDLKMLKIWRKILLKLETLEDQGRGSFLVSIKRWKDTEMLYTACEEGKLDIMKWIHDRSTRAQKHKILKYTSGSQVSLLYVALCGGHIDCAEWILSINPFALINEKSLSSFGLIHFGGSPKTINWIHSKMPSIIPGPIGVSLMNHSISRGILDLAKTIHAIDPSALTKTIELHSSTIGYFMMTMMVMSKQQQPQSTSDGDDNDDGDDDVDIRCFDILNWIHSIKPSLVSKIRFSGMNVWELSIIRGRGEKPITKSWIYAHHYPLTAEPFDVYHRFNVPRQHRNTINHLLNE